MVNVKPPTRYCLKRNSRYVDSPLHIRTYINMCYMYRYGYRYLNIRRYLRLYINISWLRDSGQLLITVIQGAQNVVTFRSLPDWPLECQAQLLQVKEKRRLVRYGQGKSEFITPASWCQRIMKGTITRQFRQFRDVSWTWYVSHDKYYLYLILVYHYR